MNVYENVLNAAHRCVYSTFLIIYKNRLCFVAPVATSFQLQPADLDVSPLSYIYYLKLLNPAQADSVSACVYVCERHRGSVAEGAACVCCGSLSVVSQLADRPGPRGAAHQRSPIHQPDRPSCWKAGRMDEGSKAGSAWLGLPVKQKIQCYHPASASLWCQSVLLIRELPPLPGSSV